MLKKNEIRILEKLLGNIRSEYNLSNVSHELKQKYSQTYKSIKSLAKANLVTLKEIGKSKIIKLDFSKHHPEYDLAESERLSNILKNRDIFLVYNEILKINKQFVCILFGSYSSGKFKKGSDIDLLFIIPEEYDINKFEKTAKNKLSIYNVDINVITEDNLFEMWANPQKLNVGNELFNNHTVLFGADSFLNLVRKYHVGR
jgi:predicted nucleotidyltransferase